MTLIKALKITKAAQSEGHEVYMSRATQNYWSVIKCSYTVKQILSKNWQVMINGRIVK